MPTFSGIRTTPPPPRPRRRPRWPEAFEKREAAQDAIDLATFRRIHDETMSAALLGARDAPDEESARAAFGRASSQVSTIESTRPAVQQAYARFYEGAQARYGDAFARQAAAIKDKQSLQRGELEIAAARDRGDEAEAVKLYEYMKVIDPGNIPLYEQAQADVPFDTLHTLASKKIDSGDPAQIRQGIEAIQGVPQRGLRKEQVAAQNQLAKRGQSELESRQRDNYRALYGLIFDMDAATTDADRNRARDEADEAIREAEDSGTIDSLQAVSLEDRLRIHYERADAPTPKTVAMAWNMVLDPTIPPEEKQNWVMERVAELGTSVPSLLKTIAAERSAKDVGRYKADANSTLAAVNYVASKRNMSEHDQADLAALAVLEVSGKDLSLKDKLEAVADLAIGIQEARRATGPAAIYTQTRISDAVAILERGGARTDDDGATVPWSSAQEMYAFLLGPKGAGPQWYENEQIRQLAMRSFPLAFWEFQTEKEQVATMERARKAKVPLVTTWPIGQWGADVLEADIDENDRAAVLEMAPPDKPITLPMLPKFSEYLDDIGKSVSKPLHPSDEVLAEMGVDPALQGFVAPPEIPAPEERVVGEVYTIRGKQYEWQLGGWNLIP